MAGFKRFQIPSLIEMEEECFSDPLVECQKTLQKTASQNTNLQGVSDGGTEIPAQSIKSVPPTEALKNSGKESSSNMKHEVSQHNQSANVSVDPPKEANIESTTTSIIKPSSNNSLLVNPRQRGNPILKSVRNITWEYASIVPDYVMGQANCALFLSLRYHQLHPNYIHERLKQLGRSYDLRVMLVQVDVKEPQHLLQDLAKICILADCTLILAFSAEEAGRYLETYKIFENKPPEVLMEKTEDNFMAKFTDCLTRVKSVNKTDCSTLLTHFGSLSNIADVSEEDLSLCPGFGPQKAQRLYRLFHEPFIRSTPATSRKDV